MQINETVLYIVILVGMMRIAEIALGEINAKRMLQEGGKEFSAWQRIPVVIGYSLWLAALLFFTPPDGEIKGPPLVVFAGLQLFRWWSIAHLKKFWTTRVIIVPLAWKVTTGPYRFMKHPIYAVLLGEVMALSLAFDQWAIGWTATGLMAWWIYLRIRAESRALQMML